MNDDMKMIKNGVLGILGAILVITLIVAVASSYKIVPPGHRGVSVTLGKVDPAARGEGLTFRKPLIEDMIIIPVQQITIKGETTCFSSDLQTVLVAYSVLYRIPESKVVELYRSYSGNPYHTLVEPRLHEVVKQVSAKYRAEDIVKNREAIKIAAVDKLKTELAGLIDIIDVPITNIDLTKELERAIEQKQVKEQEALAKEYELQKAKKEAEITIVNARAEAESVKIKGDALKNSPDVISLEIVKKWDGKSPQSVVLEKGGANVLLPLR